jgi:hypothetical protein
MHRTQLVERKKTAAKSEKYLFLFFLFFVGSRELSSCETMQNFQVLHNARCIDNAGNFYAKVGCESALSPNRANTPQGQ